MKNQRLLNGWKYCGGVTSIEYALLATLLSLAVVTGAGATGIGLGNLWTDISTAVLNAMPN